MAKTNNEMIKLLDGTDIWVFATSDIEGVPNAVPIYYTKVLDEDRLMLVDNYMKKTINNIKENPKVSVSVWNEKTGFQLKGNAGIETSGANYEAGRAMVKDGNPKGVVVVDVESVYTTSPGPEAETR